jgi:uncharacterized membrane protein YhhN
MGSVGWVLLTLAGVTAIADWLAVAAGNRGLEYVGKPATMIALVGVVLAIQPAVPAQKGWWLAAVLLGLAGDVLLMLPRDRFVAGLGAFLLGHLAYIAGFQAAGVRAGAVLLWLALLLLPLSLALLPIVRGATRAGQRQLIGPIAVYSLVTSVMVASALAGPSRLGAGGALLFIASDGLIGFRRFVRNRPWMGPAVMVTYHLGQAGLVLALLR